MSEPQKTCGPESEVPEELNGFEGISMDFEEETQAEELEPLIEGPPLPQDDTPEIKARLVHRLLAGAMAMPNYVLLAKNEEPLQSLDMDQYDRNMNGIGLKASAQLAEMIDLNPTFAKWLDKAAIWERKYGDIGVFAGAVMKSVVMEMSMRKEAAKQAAEAAKKDAANDDPQEPEGSPEEAVTDPAEGEVMGTTINEPDDE